MRFRKEREERARAPERQSEIFDANKGKKNKLKSPDKKKEAEVARQKQEADILRQKEDDEVARQKEQQQMRERMERFKLNAKNIEQELRERLEKEHEELEKRMRIAKEREREEKERAEREQREKERLEEELRERKEREEKEQEERERKEREEKDKEEKEKTEREMTERQKQEAREKELKEKIMRDQQLRRREFVSRKNLRSNDWRRRRNKKVNEEREKPEKLEEELAAKEAEEENGGDLLKQLRAKVESTRGTKAKTPPTPTQKIIDDSRIFEEGEIDPSPMVSPNGKGKELVVRNGQQPDPQPEQPPQQPSGNETFNNPMAQLMQLMQTQQMTTYAGLGAAMPNFGIGMVHPQALDPAVMMRAQMFQTLIAQQQAAYPQLAQQPFAQPQAFLPNPMNPMTNPTGLQMPVAGNFMGSPPQPQQAPNMMPNPNALQQKIAAAMHQNLMMNGMQNPNRCWNAGRTNGDAECRWTNRRNGDGK
ncbi:hypothetical protein HK098_001904 [Nowakowskiella sp. JEL0407]|nr:hypothetical protein HK098_001904 [Nowakowskiella sp. JEL0407]